MTAGLVLLTASRRAASAGLSAACSALVRRLQALASDSESMVSVILPTEIGYARQVCHTRETFYPGSRGTYGYYRIAGVRGKAQRLGSAFVGGFATHGPGRWRYSTT